MLVERVGTENGTMQSKRDLQISQIQTRVRNDVTSALQWTQFSSINIPDMFNYNHVYNFIVEQVSKMILDDEF